MWQHNLRDKSPLQGAVWSLPIYSALAGLARWRGKSRPEEVASLRLLASIQGYLQEAEFFSRQEPISAIFILLLPSQALLSAIIVIGRFALILQRDAKGCRQAIVMAIITIIIIIITDEQAVFA